MTITLLTPSSTGRYVPLELDTESELFFALCGLDNNELEECIVLRGGYRQTGDEAMEELTTVFGE